MARHELNEPMLRTLKVTTRTEFTDLRQIGLELHAYPTGKKTFSFRMRGPNGLPQRAFIGRYPSLKLSEAREKAAELVRLVNNGENITAAAAKEAKAIQAEHLARVPTLLELVREYEVVASRSLGIWMRTKTGKESEAFKRITAVYGSLFERKVTELTAAELSRATHNYAPLSGKTTANGQVSRARLYLKPVLDWAARRGKFRQLGTCREQHLTTPDLAEVGDPSADDHTITGERNRVLDQNELCAILPLLTWPAPASLDMMTPPEDDLRPIALRFLLLTGARVGELQAMRWSHFREGIGSWHKPVVKTLKGKKRQQNLPLSDAAIALLRGLPGYGRARPDARVFPNSTGGMMQNWDRITKAIFRASGTDRWHRHDLRRTLATYLNLLKVPKQVIDEILAHNASNKDEGVSRALGNYLSKQFIGDIITDPQKEALDKMAAVIAKIEVQANSTAT